LAVCQAKLASFQRFLGPGNLFYPLDLPLREADLDEVDGAMGRINAAWRTGANGELDVLVASEFRRLATGARGGRKLQICFGLVRAQWVEPYTEMAEVDEVLGEWAALLSDDGAALNLDDYLGTLCPYLRRLAALLLDRPRVSFLDLVIEFTRSHCDSGLTMAMVANQFSMNYSQFSREFKEHSGQGFHDFLLHLRIERSMDLLRESPLKIFEVAQKAGYRNTKHFLKVFKERVGISPTDYRRALAGR
jgi:AraC-like DNA-binding protein